MPHRRLSYFIQSVYFHSLRRRHGTARGRPVGPPCGTPQNGSGQNARLSASGAPAEICADVCRLPNTDRPRKQDFRDTIRKDRARRLSRRARSLRNGAARGGEAREAGRTAKKAGGAEGGRGYGQLLFLTRGCRSTGKNGPRRTQGVFTGRETPRKRTLRAKRAGQVPHRLAAAGDGSDRRSGAKRAGRSHEASGLLP